MRNFFKRLRCFFTGGHKYKASEIKTYYDKGRDVQIFKHTCTKCGDVRTEEIPSAAFCLFCQEQHIPVREIAGQARRTPNEFAYFFVETGFNHNHIVVKSSEAFFRYVFDIEYCPKCGRKLG